MKRNKRDIVFIGLIILATIFAWHGVLNQTIEGEGFYYFSPTNSLVLPNGKLADLIHGYDNFSKIAYFILQIFFGGNIQPYMTTLFVTIILVNISFYMFVKKITNNSYIALLSSIYAGINYTGSFQFYARGHFQWFIQRVPEMFLILGSFAYLFKYTGTKKSRFYLFSLILFLVSIFMTNYSTLFLPFFPSLLLVTALTKAKNKDDAVKYLLLSLPFIIINYALIRNTRLYARVIQPSQPFLEFLGQPKDIIAKISHQLVVVTVPFSLLKPFLKLKDYTSSIFKLAPFIYLFYLTTVWLLYKKKSESLTLVATSFLALLGVLFLNVYLRRFNVHTEIFQGRHYYIPAFYVAIILASFLNNLWENRKTSAAIMFLLASTWFFLNTKLIWKQVHDSQYSFTAGKIMLQQLVSIKAQLPKEAIVILPNPLMPSGGDFLNKYYSGQGTEFLYLDENWQSRIPENFDPNKLFVFTYNKEIEKGGNADLDKIAVVDESEKYRQILLVSKN